MPYRITYIFLLKGRGLNVAKHWIILPETKKKYRLHFCIMMQSKQVDRNFRPTVTLVNKHEQVLQNGKEGSCLIKLNVPSRNMGLISI